MEVEAEQIKPLPFGNHYMHFELGVVDTSTYNSRTHRIKKAPTGQLLLEKDRLETTSSLTRKVCTLKWKSSERSVCSLFFYKTSRFFGSPDELAKPEYLITVKKGDKTVLKFLLNIVRDIKTAKKRNKIG